MSCRVLLCLLVLVPGLAAAEDRVLFDFEGPDYAGWAVEGKAFGKGPARGTLPNQMPVGGFQGAGLASSYHDGDGTKGKIISPEFNIDKPWLNLLIGGGCYPNEACVNLLVDGKVARTATGMNSECLEWAGWNVADLQGKTARVEVVDNREGGWGHVAVDQITLSEEAKALPVVTDEAYNETWRPQFHFSPRRNWTNDPNGLVFYKGEYHLFFQHNPWGINWGNMSWGHAISRDLVHWEELPIAMFPDEHGTCFSGSAAVDWENSAGLQEGDEKTLIALYTGAPVPEKKGGPKFTQCLAYSNDRGRTWKRLPENPVLEHIIGGNRDPRIFWHKPSNQWVMALYLDKTDFAIFGSPNLKQWKKLCDVSMPGCGECPDFFELPLDGNKNDTRWVFTNANESYRVGRFDGTNFTPETDVIKGHYGGNYYAAQTYNDIPAEDGRRIQIGWMNGGAYPQMPFNQQMGFPCELKLDSTPEGPRLRRWPVREIDTLVHRSHGLQEAWLKPGENPLEGITGDLLDIDLSVLPRGARSVTLTVRGEKIVWNAETGKLSALGKEAPVTLAGDRLRLRVLVDRTTLEIYAQEGFVFMATCFLPDRNRHDLALAADGGMPYVHFLNVKELRSSWVAAQELLPAVKPLFDMPLRDPSVCAVNGEYYLVGTTGAPTWWQTNEGIRLWKSKDLKNWEPQGLVWSFDKDATWQNVRDGKRALWAPEIHYIKGAFWLTYCVNYGGTGLLKSVSGKPEGPYKDVKSDGPITDQIDASLFQDDDGKVYFVWQNGMIAPMKDDMSGLAGDPKLLTPANAPQVGFEGAFIFKADGKYHLCCADFINGDYHCMSATSDSLMGPYGDRYCAVPHGGHNMFFRDFDGNWWSTIFGSDPSAPIHEQAGLVRVAIADDGRIAPFNPPPEQPKE